MVLPRLNCLRSKSHNAYAAANTSNDRITADRERVAAGKANDDVKKFNEEK